MPAAQARASFTNTTNPIHDDGVSHQHDNSQPPFDLWQDYRALSGAPPADTIHFAQFPNANDQSSQYSKAQEFRDSRLRNRSKPYMRKTKGSPENGAKYSCPECPCDFTASPNLQSEFLFPSPACDLTNANLLFRTHPDLPPWLGHHLPCRSVQRDLQS